MTDNLPVTTTLPSYLSAEKSESFGNTDESDLILPRVKLLQGLSEEPAQYPLARAGEYWHTLAEQSFGTAFPVVPILVRKSYVLWAPRGSDEKILAVARDGVHWDVTDGEWSVKFPNSRRPVTLRTAKTVIESGLHLRGTSDPDDPKSPPAATETFEFIFVRPDRMELGPFIVTHQRISIKAAKDLLSKAKIRPGERFYHIYELGVAVGKSPKGIYYLPSYRFLGYVEESVAPETERLYKRLSGVDFTADGVDDEAVPIDVTEPTKF